MSGVWRLTRLVVRARLRAVGWVPWVFLVLWGIVAALGEPTVFRSFDVWLRHQSLFAGCVAILALLLVAPPMPQRFAVRWTSQLVLLVAMAIAFAAVLFATELVLGGRSPYGSGMHYPLQFVIAGLPIAAGSILLRTAGRESPQTIIVNLVMAICAASTVALAALPDNAWCEPRALFAALLCVLASVALMACSRAGGMMRTEHEDRNSR